jgi:hypothetical protein
MSSKTCGRYLRYSDISVAPGAAKSARQVLKDTCGAWRKKQRFFY